MDFSFSAEEERFRQELRQWLNNNLPLGWGTSAFKMPRGKERLQFLRDGITSAAENWKFESQLINSASYEETASGPQITVSAHVEPQ